MLRRRAERAIDEGRGRLVIEPLLEAILERAAEDDPVRSFAHRHLAELMLERDPWTAALHLRKALSQHAADDVGHSLMALAQALLGNYRAAVAAYRRALRLSPRNPWYHHNLGHLLDVALDDPRAALPHLQIALEQAEESEHEITASTAHCYARLGEHEVARQLAAQALAAAPRSKEHRALVDWIERGAPADQPVHPLRAETRAAGPRVADAVAALLERHLADAGFSEREVASARALWTDYRDERSPRVKKPEVCAAAVHYAIAHVLRARGVTQSALASQYGVTPGSVSSRFADIRTTLALRPGDPRYRT
ncbi:MAG: tetratricopeptide repeat protein [Sandaracinaceae bacterium]|nr:tetratricopeptide repeat protein [Sandaracinaceae bacterium]